MDPKPLRQHLSFFLYYIDPDICEKENYEVNKLLNSKVTSINSNFLKLLFKLGAVVRHPIIGIDQYLTRMNVRRKYEEYVKTLSASLRNQYGEYLIQIRIKVKKCVIGLGNKGPFEVGMTLHPIFGVPYIPGSAVKGIFKRAYLLWYDSIDKEERRKLDIPSSNDIFVPLNTSENPDKEDRLIFTDALPEPKKPGEICLDVMCPHIKLDREIITEFENPIPIQFWILRDAELTFYVYPSVSACIKGNFRKYIRAFRQFLENLRETSMGDFTVTRTTNGEWLLAFGAKTSSGYGIFEIEEVKFND